MNKSKSSRAQRRATGNTPVTANQPMQPARLRPLCAALIGIMPAIAGADIVPDQAAAQRAAMNQTANGTPLVNIVDPNQRGISHNKFKEFNVDANGVVFNNSMANGVSAIGGQAMKNPQLNSQARAIIGEVTGSGRSALNGAMEIFGGKADLLIANPNGIQVNGASTVNANNLTLSTGRVLGQPDGSVRLGVDGGAVSIEGTGISTAGLTHFDIISRTAQINGQIQGPADIKIVAGQTEYDPATRTHVAKPGAQAVEPIAIDASHLGSMYGGRIELVATDSGAGVRHQGIILGERDISVTADGDIVLGAAQSTQGNINVAGKSVTINGTPDTGRIGLTSHGDIAIRALQSVGVNANLVSQRGTIAIDAGSLVQRAADILSLRDDATTVSVPSLRINVGDYRIEGELFAVRPTGERIEGAVVQIERGNYVVRDAEGNVLQDVILASSARLAANHGNIHVKATSMTNDGGVALASDGTLEFDIAGMMLNQGMITANGNIDMKAGQANNAGSMSAVEIAVRAASMANSGETLAYGNLDITAATLDNTGRLAAGGNATLGVTDRIDNAGTLLADGTVNIDGVKTLVNRDGAWLQGNAVQLRNIETMTNRDKAVLVAQSGLSLDGIGALTNDDASMQGQTVDMRDSGTVRNVNGGLVAGIDSLSIQHADSLTNDDARMQGTNVSISDVATVTNANGAVTLASNDLTIAGAAILDNQGAQLLAGNALSIHDVRTVHNDAGSIKSSGTVALDAVERFTNRNAANIVANGNVDLHVDTLVNTDSAIQTGGNLTIEGLSVENAKTASAAADAAAILGANGTLTITAPTIQNSGGRIQGGEGVSMVGQTIDNNAGGMMMSGGALQLAADTLNNRAFSVIRGDGDVTIGVNTLTNSNASDPATEAATEAATEGEGEGEGETEVKYAAQISAGGALGITANTVDNASGAMLLSAGDMTVSASQLHNTAGAVIVAQGANLGLAVRDQIRNDSAAMVGQNIDLTTARLENHGTIEADTNAIVNVDSFSNTNGTIAAGREVDFRTRQNLVFDDTTGTFFAGGRLKMHTDGDATVTTRLENLGTIDLHADGDITNNGAILSGWAVALAGDNIKNSRNSLIWGMQDVSLEALGGTIENERNGNILSQGSMSLAAKQIYNRAGTIRSEGTMAIDADRLENLSDYNESDVTFGPGSKEEAYREVGRGIASTYEFRLAMTLPTFISNIELDKVADISAGGNLYINQRDVKIERAAGEAAPTPLVHNLGGTIAAAGNLLVKGDLVNESKSQSVDLMDYLNNPLEQSIRLSNWWSPTLNFPTLAAFFDTIFQTYKYNPLTMEQYDFLRYAENWGSSAEPTSTWARHFNNGDPIAMLKQMDGATFNTVMSKIFGPTWKATSNADLRARWREVSGNQYAELKTQKFYFLPAEKASISAGGNFVHTGGEFTNGIGGVQQQNKAIQVKVGDQTVDASVPPYDVVVNPKQFEELSMGISTLPTLADLLQVTGMFNVSKAWNDLKAGRPLAPGNEKVVPMYETQMKYINQNDFYGGAYFFNQVGYDPQKPANIIGDNYFINELIRRQLNEEIGTFFAVRDGVQGADMVKMLMDNAGALMGLVMVEDVDPHAAVVSSRVVSSRRGLGETGGTEASEPAAAAKPTFTKSRQAVDPLYATLEVGKPLTPEQMAGLKTDIIWFVTESVKGENVLVPRVYLAPKTQEQIRNGEASGSAVVSAGGSVVVDATKATNASGSIVAKKDVFIKAEGDVVNISAGMTGGIKAGGDVALISTEGNVLNSGAYVKGGGNVTLLADQGSVNITASVGYDQNGKHRVHEFDDSITAGGSVAIQGADVTLNSAYIAANENVVINATKGSIKSNEMHQLDSDYDYSYVGGGTNYIKESHTEASAVGMGSSIHAGNALVMQSKENIELEGGQYSGAAGYMKAGNEINIKTSTNYGYTHDEREVSQFGAGAGINATGHTANANSNTMEGSGSYAGRAHRDNPNDDGQSNSTGGKKAGRAPMADTANASFGYSKTTDKTTTQSMTHNNANLSFGAGGLSMEGKTIDFGGADITTPGKLSMTADDIKTTKYVDRHDVKQSHEELFIGVKAEGHSSIADAANKYGELGTKATQDGKSTDAGMTALQVAGDVSNLVFNDLVGGSVSFGMNHSKTNSSSSNRAENISHIKAGEMALNAKNDMTLNGVDIDVAGKASLEAGGNIAMNAARTWDETKSSTDSFNVGVSAGASVSAFGAGMGTSIDVSGSHERSGSSSTKYTNSTLDADKLSIKSGGDTTLTGATANANDVKMDIAGNLNVTSVQDKFDSNTTKGHWGGSIGAAITTSGAIIPTASVQGGGGSEHRNDRTTAEQSGITGKNSFEGNIGGDLNMKGSHLVDGSGNGKLNVDGKVNVASLTDKIEQDGGYGGGGGGISRAGLGTLNAYGETVDEIHKEDRQNATIAGMNLNAGEVNGNINTDATKMTESIRDEKESGNQISFTAGIGDMKGAGKKKPDGGNSKWYDTPSGDATPKPSPKPTPDGTRPTPDGTRPTPSSTEPVITPVRPPATPEFVRPAVPETARPIQPDNSRPLTPGIIPVDTPTMHPPAGSESVKPVKPDNARPLTPADMPKPSTPDAGAKPSTPGGSDGEVVPSKKWPEVKIPTPFIGSPGSSQALPGFNPPAKMNTNTGKDNGAIGGRGGKMNGPVTPKIPVPEVRGQGDASTLYPPNSGKAPAADPKPVRHYEVVTPKAPVLSPGSSTAVPGFTPPAGNNTNTGKDTGAIGGKGGKMNGPVTPKIPVPEVRGQGDASTLYPPNSGKAPAADPTPVRHYEVESPKTPVLSPGSSTAMPGFTPPAGNNTNTGKDTGAIGGKGGKMNGPVTPKIPVPEVRGQGDISTLYPPQAFSADAGSPSVQSSIMPSTLSYGPMLRQGANN